MKAITVRQPYATAIIDLGKDTENRTRRWRYQGTLAIHAAKLWHDRLDDPVLLDAYTRWLWDDEPPPAGGWAAAARQVGPIEPGFDRDEMLFPRGVILGTVDLKRCHPAIGGCCAPWGERGRGTFHLELVNPRRLVTPIPWQGKQQMWDLPDEVLAGQAWESL